MHLTSDQLQLRDTLRGLLEEKLTPEYRIARAKAPTTSDSALTKALADLAFVDGFCGEDPVFTLSDLGVVAFEFGRSLLPEPYLHGLLLGAVASSLQGGLDKEALSSQAPLSLALASSNLSRLEVTQSAVNSGACEKVKVTGQLKGVWLPDTANIVDGKTKEGVQSTSRGVVVFGSDRKAEAFFIPLTDAFSDVHASVVITASPSLDLLQSLKTIELKDAPAICLSFQTATLLKHAAYALVANEMAGICDYVISLTCDYVKTRHQFGVPVGGFQALQHSLATSYVDAESLRALASFAAWAITHSPSQAPLTALSALARAIAVTPLVCERAIQTHGGIGFTWEYELHLYLRRARTLAATWQMNSGDVNSLLNAAGS